MKERTANFVTFLPVYLFFIAVAIGMGFWSATSDRLGHELGWVLLVAWLVVFKEFHRSLNE